MTSRLANNSMQQIIESNNGSEIMSKNTIDLTTDRTKTQNTISIVADFNSMKSSMVQFEEQVKLTKFLNYSSIVIKKNMDDNITSQTIHNMVKQLCSLAEYVWDDEQRSGEIKKYNVKQQIQTVLNNQKDTVSLQIADCLLDELVEKVIKDNKKQQLIQLAQNILKLSVKATGCLANCSYQ